MRGLLCASFSLLALWLWVGAAPATSAADGDGGVRAGAAVQAERRGAAAGRAGPGRLGPGPPLAAVRACRCWAGCPCRWSGSCVTRSAQPLPFVVTQPLWTRPLIAGDALWFYGAHILWPARLGPDYGRTPEWVMRHTWMLGLLPCALAALLWRSRQNGGRCGAAAVFTRRCCRCWGWCRSRSSGIPPSRTGISISPCSARRWPWAGRCPGVRRSPRWRVPSAALCALGLAALGLAAALFRCGRGTMP